jgi:hypothetical protein
LGVAANQRPGDSEVKTSDGLRSRRTASFSPGSNPSTFSGSSSDRALIRRLYFDLIGLPPAPGTVESLCATLRRTRMSRWSIVARFPTWRAGRGIGSIWSVTRRRSVTVDYTIPGASATAIGVIRAFNADVPYDQFVVEHIW